MRKDFEKVLCEEPRHGSSMKNGQVKRGRRYKDLRNDHDKLDELPRKSQMKPKGRTLWRKHFGEHLAPLKRFLRSRVGKNWDKVNSEIRERVRANKATQLHILEHLEGYVHLHVEVENGRVFEVARRYYSSRSELYDTGYTFYVDPKTNILRVPKKMPPWRTWSGSRTSTQNPSFKAKNGEYYEKIHNVWYAVEYAELMDLTWLEKHMNKKWYPNTNQAAPIEVKRQLNKKELKQIPRKIRDISCPESKTKKK